MKKPNQEAILMEQIIALRKQQTQELQELKNQYHRTINSFSAINLLKTSIQEVVSTPHLTANIIQSAMHLGAQYLTKTILKDNPNKRSNWLSKIAAFAMRISS
jgi:hypothetical protein